MIIEKRTLSENEIRECSKLIFINGRKLHYKRIDKGQYEVYCPFCQTYKQVSNIELKMIRYNKSCPTCFTHFTGCTKEDTRIVEDYVQIENVGYRIKARWQFGLPVETLETEQCLYFHDEYKTWVKDLFLGNFGRKICKNDEDYISHQWRLSRSCNWKYNTYIYPNPGLPLWLGNPNVIRKIALEKNISENTRAQIKSNQKKMIIDNSAIGLPQIKAIVAFDLNDIEDVYKHLAYIEKNDVHITDFLNIGVKLNKFYLDYLDRNDIDLGKFFTFSRYLTDLGLKLEKPTDFTHRYDAVLDMHTQHEQEIKDKKIEKRYSLLPKYIEKEITISPFKTAEQIVNCGKALHNCIGGYVTRYADGSTDLYHLDVKGELKVAIEISKGELRQAYEDGNKRCSDKLFEHIRTFCTTNGINLGYYA